MSSTSPTAAGSFRLPCLHHARVEDAMHPGVISCAADTPARDVARAMSTSHIHCVAVSRELSDMAPAWSFITALDLVREGAQARDRTAAELHPRTALTVRSDDPLDRAAQLMLEHEVEHLIVIEDEQPVGVLSSLDLVGIIAWGEA